MIWLIGNKGMLGTELAEVLSAKGLPFVGTDLEVSILDPGQLRAFAKGKDFSWIVNCAAYTAVDKAEDDRDLCMKINRDGPANIGRTASEIGARVVHISTDYVFDGTKTTPYLEDDPVSPVGVYGVTKAEGEKALFEECSRAFILRTAWLYGRHGKNFVHTMLRLMKEKDTLGVVADQRGTPTWARDLAGAIADVVRADNGKYGIYHYAGEGETNWYEFAREIQRRGRAFGLLADSCTVKPLTTDQYPTKAKRPAYSVLCKEKIRSVFGLDVPDWKTSLESFLREEAGR